MVSTTLPGVLLFGVAGSRPAANAVANGTLYSATDTGTVTQSDGVSTWSTFLSVSATGIPATIVDVKGDLIAATAADTVARLAAGTNGYGLLAASGQSTGLIWAEILPWHISLIPMVLTPEATVGTWTTETNVQSGVLYPFYVPGSTANSGGAAYYTSTTAAAQNDAVAYDVVLAAGTWDFNAWVIKTTNTGIITLNQDGASQGTVDTYAAATAVAKVSITGWTVAATGKKRMQLLMATKNGSSSSYALRIFAIEFRRTA